MYLDIVYSLCPQINQFLESVPVNFFLSLTNFIEKNNNIYEVQRTPYEKNIIW